MRKTLEEKRSRAATIQIACMVAMLVVVVAMSVVVLAIIAHGIGVHNVHP